MQPKFRSDVTVQLVQSMGDDMSVVESARVSTVGGDSLNSTSREVGDKDAGLINYLMRDRHGTPFEHNGFTFYIEAPIFVFREFMRHRIASYNEESGRYKKLEPVFYIPKKPRGLIQSGKPGAYEFYEGSDNQYLLVAQETADANRKAYEAYEEMLDAGVAREVARGVLPVNLYSSMFVTMNARALMNFLSLRTKREGTHFPSFPQREIEMVAEQMEDLWAEKMPIVWQKFNEHGRVSP
jgi:thymidylate synthase (FAD)